MNGGAEAAKPAKPGRLSLATFGQGLGWVADDDLPDARGSGGWSGTAVHAVNGGAGIEPWPRETVITDSVLAAATLPSTTDRMYAQAAANAVFFACGRHFLQSVALSAGSWANLTLRHTQAAGLVYSDLGYYRDDVLLARTGAGGVDILRWDTGSNVVGVWRSAEIGPLAQGYAGSVIYARDQANLREQLSIGILHNNGTALRRWKWLDAPIVRLGAFAGRMAIATLQSLYTLGGQVSQHEASDPASSAQWTEQPEPLFSHGQWVDTGAGDLRFLVSFLGKLYTWLGGGVMEYDPGQGRQGWRAMGPRGRNCYGACVAAGYLIVATESGYGTGELWAFDGFGWWRIAAGAAGAYLWPAALSGAGGNDLIVFANAASTYRLYRLRPRGIAAPAFASDGTWTSPLLTAGNADAVKAWRKVGAYFAWPEANGNSASSDQVTITLAYSVDAGQTFTTAATASVGLGNSQALVLELPSPIPTSRFLQLRVSWSSVADWAPVLNRVIVDYAVLDTTPRRRRWKLKAVARDKNVRRDTGVLAATGRQQIDALWEAWESQSPVSFRDADYDSDPVTHTVRVLDIKEAGTREAGGGKPSDAGRWGDAVIELELAQV